MVWVLKVGIVLSVLTHAIPVALRMLCLLSCLLSLLPGLSPARASNLSLPIFVFKMSAITNLLVGDRDQECWGVYRQRDAPPGMGNVILHAFC